ncbi:ADP-glyceromanno-heptose 6-epimerase [Helicobacter aurati]|uniref:ADP-glyceromanno-heptose 6-epimerase n=1 Tax=Helicobacter aurati TaxID=137778 RepID=A0A3D8J0F9_9HELI|nr:NAD-dependent epimerase/dehydratase family protein [Helicobacter aurati]RDU70843.1 ADP-glyceromanno-heptose 6-epimerase [Helicobacter aurati]
MQQFYVSPLLDLDSKTILITGAAGFIGSNLVAYFSTHYPKARILALDYFRDGMIFSHGNPTTLGHFKNLTLSRNVEILCIDITNTHAMKTIKHHGKIDYIFHQAAISDTTCMDMNRVLAVNLHAFRDIIHIALRNEAHLIYASSAATYGNTQAPNSVGNNEIPENIYGFSKLCMDRENARRQAEFHSKGLGLIGLRYFNVYGRNEFYKGRTSSMILQLGLQALEKKKVKLFEFGEQQRDFVYINDVIQANIRALEAIYLVFSLRSQTKHALDWQKAHKIFHDSIPKVSTPTHNILQQVFGNNFQMLSQKLAEQWLENGAIYNVGFGTSRSFNDMVAILQQELNISFEIEYIKNPYVFFQNHTLADSQNFVPQYQPAFSLEEGIRDYATYIQQIFQEIQDGKKEAFC